MNSKHISVTFVVGVLAISFAFTASGRPPLTPHSHTPATIEWEQDGVEDGNSAHNHRNNRSFGGNAQTIEPFSIFQCWDNRSRRLDLSGDFDDGHCFIDESSPGNVVRYFFVGGQTDGAGNRIWTTVETGTDPGLRGFQARRRIVSAFDAYNAILSDSSNLVTGVEFVEVDSPPAEIQIFWEDQGGANNGGSWTDSTKELRFDHSMLWFFPEDPMLGDPFGIDGFSDDYWHFYSIALHEVGHAVGFEHQSDDADVMKPPVGEPASVAGARYFMGLDADTIAGVRDVYSQPSGAPTEAPTIGSISAYFYWTNIFNTDYYELHRSSTVGGTYVFLHQEFVPTSGVILTSFGISPPYYVKVRACNSAGCGPFSAPRLYN